MKYIENEYNFLMGLPGFMMQTAVGAQHHGSLTACHGCSLPSASSHPVTLTIARSQSAFPWPYSSQFGGVIVKIFGVLASFFLPVDPCTTSKILERETIKAMEEFYRDAYARDGLTNVVFG